jgi:hypothetical protein
MLFPDDALFDYVLIDLGEAVAAAVAPPINPLPCDRYVARSCLQKAIRRAEPGLAQRALANLFLHDRRIAWRALTIIALEDVGVANVDLLAGIVAAQRDRSWRARMGGDWPVLAEVARQMADSLHCQAACDLLLRATNDPAMETDRAAVLELHADILAKRLWDRTAPPIHRALAVLALGGELAEGQRFREPAAAFDILNETGRSSHVVATCRAAWKISRNPMALLLPMVWEQWMLVGQRHTVIDDPMPPVQMLGDVPGYALDQFTRIGNTVSRTLAKEGPALRSFLDTLGVLPNHRSQTIGDALFLMEGGLLRRRVVWPFADAVRKPDRMLPTAARLGERMQNVVTRLVTERSQLETVRRLHLGRFAG